MHIVKYPDPLLKKKAKEIPAITKEHLKLIPQMIKIMDANEGIGLAGPQVGVGERVIVIKDGARNHVFFNPIIVKASRKKEIDEEGCLSLPGIFLKIKRSEEVEIAATNEEGKTLHIQAKGLGARIFQHEIDHLEGKLIINRVGPLSRLQLRKQLRMAAHESR